MTQRNIEALVNHVREKLRQEDTSYAAAIGFTDGQIEGALQRASDRLSESCPYDDSIILRRALPADDDYIVDAEDVGAFVDGSTCTVANSPDVPRNLTVTYTEAAGTITALVVTVVGTDKNNDSLTETFTFSSELTFTGTEEFKTVTSVTATTITGNGVGDTLDVGIGTDVITTREIDLSSVSVLGVLTDLFGEPYNLTDVYYVEYPMWYNPRSLFMVEWLGRTSIRLKMNYSPTYDANIKLFYARKHVLTSTESSLTAKQEQVVVDGACYYSLLSLGGGMDNAVPLGANAANNLKTSASFYYDEFMKGIRAVTPMKTVYTISEG